MRHDMSTGRLNALTRTTTRLRHGTTPRRTFYKYTRNPAFDAEAQPTVTSPDGLQTLRTRQHGNPSLPLPPLMDPLVVARKDRHKQKKPRATKSTQALTDFQKKLRLNPFAHALATDIRLCKMTSWRLPAHFLIPFAADSTPNPDKPSLIPALRKWTQGRSYMVNDRETVRVVFKGRGKKARWGFMLSDHVAQRAANESRKSKGYFTNMNNWHLDEDMAEAVLQQMRENVVEGLQGCYWHPKRQDRVFESNELEDTDWEDAACIVAFASDAPAGPESVPYYDLNLFLKPDQVEKLQQDSANVSRIVLKRHKETVATALALDKLSTFVAPRIGQVESDRDFNE